MDTTVRYSAEAEELRAKVRDIQTNPANPRHIGYRRQDAGVMSYIDGLYREVYGSGAPKAAPAAKPSAETTNDDSQHSPYLSPGAGLIGRR
jgi:hypothetical protein